MKHLLLAILVIGLGITVYNSVTSIPNDSQSPYSWTQLEDKTYALIDNRENKQIGVFDPKESKFYNLGSNNEWTEGLPPCELPNHFGSRRHSAPTQNKEISEGNFFGVESDKIKEKSITVNGSHVSENQAIHLLRSHPRRFNDKEDDKKIPDDVNYIRVLILGQTKTDTKQIVTDINENPDIKKLTENWVVKVYDKTNMTYKSVIEDVGYECPNKQAIYVLSPNGKVLHRQFDYGGPNDLRKVFKAVRERDPKYKDENNPDLRKSGTDYLSNIMEFIQKIPAIVWIIAIVGIWLLYKK